MTYFNKIILIAAAIAVPMASCNTDELQERNINPQALNTVPMEFLFTGAEMSTSSNGQAGDNWYINWRTNIGFAGYAIQQLSTVSGGISPGDKYFDNAESYSAPWEFIYGDQLKNLAEIIKQTGPDGFDKGKENLRNAARILRVFNFHRLTDYYGNIPYSDALKGIDGVFLPKYDTQEQIYADLLKELEEASAGFTPIDLSVINDKAFADADLFYNGDVDKWKRFGYSLMLRLAMRISNVDEAKAKEFAQKAVTGGVFTSNDDIVWVPHDEGPSQWTNQNGISRSFVDGGQPTTLSKTLIDELKGPDAATITDDDPRLMIFSRGVNGNVDPLAQRGLPNGLDQGMLNAMEGPNSNPTLLFSQLNDKFLQYNEPYMLMNYAEVEFLQAEAAERGFPGVSDPQGHYESGVKAAMQMYVPYDASFVVSDAQVAAYLAARPYPAGGSLAEKQNAIGTQLWVSDFLNWWEAWSNWRRLQYPALVPVNYPGNVTGGTIPRRLRLPNQEIATNPNYQEGATMPDLVTTKVWWDVL